MKHILWLSLIFLIVLPIQAQDELTPYERALERIEEARISGATELGLAHLGLTELPPEIGQLENLKKLYLGGNRLSYLPPEIGELRNLELLMLGANQLTDTGLPKELFQLENLESLYLNYNQLSSLPPEIGQLENLQALGLDNNQLDDLPPEIGGLTKLCFLFLQENEFRHLPLILGELTQLADSSCMLSIYGNPLITPPPEVIYEDTSVVLAYLHNPEEWHKQRTQQIISKIVSVIGFLAIVVLGLRWRYLRLRMGKKKREV